MGIGEALLMVIVAILVFPGSIVWIQERVANFNEELMKCYYMMINSDFGVIWSYGGDSRAR